MLAFLWICVIVTKEISHKLSAQRDVTAFRDASLVFHEWPVIKYVKCLHRSPTASTKNDVRF